MASIVFAGPAAVVLVSLYYFIPFFIVRGAPDSLGRLRPLLLSGCALILLLGFYKLWRAKQSGTPVAALSASILWLSAVAVLSMMLFSQVIANSLANSLAS